MAKKKTDDAATIVPASAEPLRIEDRGSGAVVPAEEEQTISLIRLAIERGTDPDKLTKLFDLHERHQKNIAVQAYNMAMAECQREMPAIKADSFNKQTNSSYASVEGMNRVIKPIYTQAGLSLCFGEEKIDVPEWVRTTCDVRHVGGHSERFFIDLPMDGKGIKGNANMTPLHGRMSTDTYAQGRLLRKIFNLTIEDDATDDDGNTPGCIGLKEIEQINTIIENIRKFTDFDMARFLKWQRAEDLGKIQMANFQSVIDNLNRKLTEAPATKQLLDEWNAILDGDPSIDAINKELLPRFQKLPEGGSRNAVWDLIVKRVGEHGVIWTGKAFEPKGAK